MFSQMMGGNNNSSNNGLGQMMAMSMFMGDKNNNPFEGMFDFNLSEDDDTEEETNKEEE